MSTITDKFEHNITYRITGLLIMTLVILLSSYLLPALASLKDFITVVFVMFSGVTIAVIFFRTITIRSSFWLLLFIGLGLVVSFRLGALMIISIIGTLLLKILVEEIKTSTLFLVFGVAVLLSSMLFAYSYPQWYIVGTGNKLSLSETINALAFLFAFIAANLVGYFLCKHHWLSNYQFIYKSLTFYAKVSFVALVLWFALYYFGFYEFLLLSKIGKVIILIDTITMSYIVIFLLLYFTVFIENFKIGTKINQLIEIIGKYSELFIAIAIFIMLVLK